MKEWIVFAIVALLTLSAGALAFIGSTSPATACNADTCHSGQDIGG